MERASSADLTAWERRIVLARPLLAAQGRYSAGQGYSLHEGSRRCEECHSLGRV